MKSSKFYTFNVGIEAGNISLTELSIPPADQLNTIHYGCPTLGVAIDGTLNLFHLRRNAADLLQLDIWTPRGDNVGEIETFWLRVGTFNLNAALTRDGLIRVWSGEKSGTLFIFYASSWRVHRLDIQTGEVEEVTGFFREDAMPMEIDWPAFFMSRLGVHLC
jgi:hypothetical protein